MGHSSINVSLTYLRGLEIAELKEEDMPTPLRGLVCVVFVRVGGVNGLA